MMRASLALAATALAVAAGTTSATGAPVETLNLTFSGNADDSSGYGHDGIVGSHVRLSSGYADFDYHSQSEGVDYNLEHLVIVPDARDGSLDPGWDKFTVAFDFRTGNDGNMVQKGQAGTYGGQVKIELPGGRPTCVIKTSTGNAEARASRSYKDRQWHRLSCVKTPTDVTLYVDGSQVGKSTNDTGYLNNSKPWSIGGKSECGGAVTCDYYPGDIDNLVLTKG